MSSGGSSQKSNGPAAFTGAVIGALKATQELQSNVHKLLETFTSWKSGESEASINSVKATIKDIQSCQSKLEKTSNAFPKLPDAQPVSLGNSGLITLDSGEDKSTLYRDLLHAYSWVSKLNDDANKALRQLKRKYPEPEHFPEAPKRSKDPKRLLEDLCPVLRAQNPDLLIEIAGSPSSCLKITLKGILYAFIVFSGGKLNRAIIRSSSNDICPKTSDDLWTPSKFITFRKITDVAQFAILRFSSSAEPERSSKEFVNWLSYYQNLFSEKCEQCKRHLKSDTKEGHLLPPLWRDIENGKAYHLTCRIRVTLASLLVQPGPSRGVIEHGSC